MLLFICRGIVGTGKLAILIRMSWFAFPIPFPLEARNQLPFREIHTGHMHTSNPDELFASYLSNERVL